MSYTCDRCGADLDSKVYGVRMTEYPDVETATRGDRRHPARTLVRGALCPRCAKGAAIGMTGCDLESIIAAHEGWMAS